MGWAANHAFHRRLHSTAGLTQQGWVKSSRAGADEQARSTYFGKQRKDLSTCYRKGRSRVRSEAGGPVPPQAGSGARPSSGLAQQVSPLCWPWRHQRQLCKENKPSEAGPNPPAVAPMA
jgi:hypothetical protein